MSIKGVIQFVIAIDNYYIIEYPQQGLLYFNISLFQERGSGKIAAIPYQAYNLSKNNNQANKIYQQPKIEDEMIVSSLCFAKYSDEVLKINDWMRFRLQIQAYPQLQSNGIYLSLDLKLNHKKIQQINNQGDLIQTVVLRINDIESGTFNYFQAQFSSPYSSKLNFFIYSHLTTFKFAKFTPSSKQLNSFEKQRLKVKSLEQLVQLSKKNYPNENIQKILYVNLIKKLRIGQYLIAQKIAKYKKQKLKISIKLDEQFIKTKKLQQISEKDLKEYLDTFYPQKTDICMILELLNIIREENFDFIEKVIEEWKSGGLNLAECQKQFEVYQRQKYGQRVFKTVIHGKLQMQKKKQLGSRQNKKIVKQIRQKNIIMNNYPLQNIKEAYQKDQEEIIFYELTIPFTNQAQKSSNLILSEEDQQIFNKGNKLQYSQKHMLIVLCHGFQGTSYDMQLIKKWILQQLPDAYYLVSKYNEDNTEGNISHMGKRLSEEIQNFISNYMEEYQQENVIINLVGHSLGGIIARAALPYLEKYRFQMGFYCSLSSPHLGYLNGVSGLIKVGLWAIRRWKKIQSLQQLSLQDNKDPRKTFLYELSKIGPLKYFRKIILISSFQDSYVSWHSARITSHKSKNSESKVQQQMQANILGDNIYGATVHRLDINFNVKTTNLDSFIGRTAHINLIIKQKFFRTIYLTIPKLFDLIQFQRKGLFL